MPSKAQPKWSNMLEKSWTHAGRRSYSFSSSLCQVTTEFFVAHHRFEPLTAQIMRWCKKNPRQAVHRFQGFTVCRFFQWCQCIQCFWVWCLFWVFLGMFGFEGFHCKDVLASHCVCGNAFRDTQQDVYGLVYIYTDFSLDRRKASATRLVRVLLI